MPAASVVAVVVAYNRRELLAETLRGLRAQTVAPVRIVVVDNASTDGTTAMVGADFDEVELVTLERNTGGAGGFAVGIERALQFDPQWVWVMDDDTVPLPEALSAMLEFSTKLPEATVLASRVLWTDGREHPMNMPRRRPFTRVSAAAAAAGGYPIRSISFVSAMFRTGAIRRSGLPIADYFLWNDDFEFSTRVLRRRQGFLVTNSVVEHRTTTFGGTDADPGARFYLEVRNKVWLLTRSNSLGPLERLLYGGSTLRRWARTFARSKNRGLLADGLRRGLRDGITGRPRPNAEVLADLDTELVRGQREVAEAVDRPDRAPAAGRGRRG
ncbi:glycosyltransferase family 2 protein [Naumannella halotolerans]|uniref:GT2 family glycosyltransferase n=1 Tax=Naumannella halotolerans TaxID=993414 RepID=A0A4R7JAF4_9ACTN|nr:glycosyltransferase family 2 protein [Naumannella halotolerans]TDT33369.1 GT2 family glycosyltransferase [Naumannella halotolerans]